MSGMPPVRSPSGRGMLATCFVRGRRNCCRPRAGASYTQIGFSQRVSQVPIPFCLASS
jgi:hypothetical protein